MVKAADDACAPTSMQLAAWAEDQGITLDEMHARVAGNRAAVVAAVMRMARMVEEARTRAAPDQARPEQGCDLTRENGPVQADH